MWIEFQRCGIFDEVVQWRTLSTFLESLTFVSACWSFCFPEIPRPPVPGYEHEPVQHLAHLDMILEVLTLVRIALQIPTTAVAHTRHAAANRYELHRCRITAYLLICFLQRLVSQDNGYIPPFFEVLHFYKTSLMRDIMYSSFADQRHLKSFRARLPDLYDFIQDPGHHQQTVCLHPDITVAHSILRWGHRPRCSTSRTFSTPQVSTTSTWTTCVL